MQRILNTAAVLLLISLAGHFSSVAEVATVAPIQPIVEHSSNPLQDYLAKEDSSFHWHKVREGEFAGTKYVEIILASQTWREIVWKHRLFIVKPEKVSKSKQAILVVGGGKWNEQFEDPAYEGSLPKEAILFTTLAQQLESPIAVLLQVPQQPIFGDMVEDEIISYTFEKYLDTGDPEWPLLLPMVKSAVRGMDTVQAFCENQWGLSIKSFTVTGGSKRGWTTWLTGATDPRVTAIAPIVINMLNLKLQMEHQQATWGKFSPQIHDYTERDIPERMDTASGEKLLRIVDPLAYRDSLKLPKLIILGTNDPYWTLDALNLYWSQLLGRKYILYVPNNGHGIMDFPRVLGGVSALHEQAQGGDKMPDVKWSFSVQGGKVGLSIKSDTPPTQCQVWSATSKTRDFRESLWTASEVSRGSEEYTIEASMPEAGFKAIFGEVQYAREYLPLYLSTNVWIIPPLELSTQAK